MLSLLKKGGLQMKGFVGVFVGLITIDGLSNVGPKIIFDHREKECANCLIRLAFKGNKNSLS